MKRAMIFGVAALTAFGFVSTGCLNGNNTGSSGTGGKGSGGSGGASSGGASGGSGGSGGVSSGGASGGSGGSGGVSSGGASGGSSSGGASGGSGGSTTSTGACGTDDGSYAENTTFGTEGATDPYKLNKWGTWGNTTEPALTQTTTGPSGLDCSSGCAMLTIDFSDGTKQYSAGSVVEYFGTASDSVENLLNETITAKIAVGIEQASGANTAVPIDINLFGQDTYASTTGTDNEWVNGLGSASSLDAGSGWHTVTYKVTDAKVPSWSPTRTVCASGLHAIGIAIQNNAGIDGSNGAVVTLYIQSVSVGSGSSDGSGGSGGSAGSGGSGGSGGAGGASSGGATGGSSTTSSSGGSGGESGGAGGASSGGASGGSTSSSGGSGGSTSSSCGTTDGSYTEDTTFGTADATDPYKVNKWGTWGNTTEPTLTQTTTGPSGLDCGSGCAMLTIDFSDGTKQYSAGSFVEYFGTAADSVENLLNETITAKIAVGVAQASGANTAVPISVNLFGQDTYTSTSGTDNAWADDLGSASALDAASGWHTVTFKVVDAQVPSWSPTRTVCASGLHAIGITMQNTADIDGTNGAVVTLYVQGVSVSTP